MQHPHLTLIVATALVGLCGHAQAQDTHEVEPALTAPQPTEPAFTAPPHATWAWTGAGGGLVASGLAFDLLAPTSNNGQADAADWLPVGLYTAGGALLLYGLYQLITD